MNLGHKTRGGAQLFVSQNSSPPLPFVLSERNTTQKHFSIQLFNSTYCLKYRNRLMNMLGTFRHLGKKPVRIPCVSRALNFNWELLQSLTPKLHACALLISSRLVFSLFRLRIFCCWQISLRTSVYEVSYEGQNKATHGLENREQSLILLCSSMFY